MSQIPRNKRVLHSLYGPVYSARTYALTISGEQKFRDGTRILFGSMKSKTMIEVKQPRPETGKKNVSADKLSENFIPEIKIQRYQFLLI